MTDTEDVIYLLKDYSEYPLHTEQSQISSFPADAELPHWTDRIFEGQQLLLTRQENENYTLDKTSKGDTFCLNEQFLLTFNPEVFCQFTSKSSSTVVTNQSVTVQGDAAETAHHLKVRLSVPKRFCPGSTMSVHGLMLQSKSKTTVLSSVAKDLHMIRYCQENSFIFSP